MSAAYTKAGARHSVSIKNRLEVIQPVFLFYYGKTYSIHCQVQGKASTVE
jgi:hypothetical protein